MNQTDLFGEQVDHITLIIYTENGELEQIQEIYRENMEENHTVSLILPPGNHTAVAWGNIHTENYRLYNHETTSGQQLEMTCIDNYKMTIFDPGSIFHAFTPLFPVVAGKEQTIPMKMVKNSNQVKVIIKGLTEEDLEDAAERFELRLTSNNWRYNFDNTISTEQKITYLTKRIPDDDNNDPDDIAIAFMFYPLKLSADDMETELTLQYRNPDTNRQAVLTKPLVPYLLNRNGSTTGIVPATMDDEEYLERQDTHEVTFIIGVDVYGNISIEEWDGINQGGEL